MSTTKKHILLSIIATIMLVITISGVAYATATKDAYVYHMHTDDYQDADNFKRLLNEKGYTTTHYYGSSCYDYMFDDCDRTVKYWSAHGNKYGKMWGSRTLDNALSAINIYGTSSDWETSTVTKSDWDGDLEFVFIAACFQLDSNIRYKYARGMLGTNRVRVISAYHDISPGSTYDYKVTQKFEYYADQSNSVKYSWINANEYYANQGYTGAKNYCVLTHSGNVQYSRMPGFGGLQYPRPGTGTAEILRFSRVNPGGTPQPLTSSKNSNIEDNAGLILNCELKIPETIPNYTLIAEKADISINEKSDIYKTMTSVKAESNEGLYTMHELGDKPIGFSKEKAIKLTRNWVNKVYNKKGRLFTSNLKEVVPLVVAEVNLDGNTEEEKEETFAYSVRFSNMYDGIRICDNFYLALVDSEGIASSMLRWNNFSKSTFNQTVEPLSYNKAINILSKSIVKDPNYAMRNPNDNITINNSEIVFSNEISKNGEYRPTWQFDMADGTTILIDCFDSTVLSIK